MPNFSFQGGLEVTQMPMLDGWGGVGLTLSIRLISVLNWTCNELPPGTELGNTLLASAILGWVTCSAWAWYQNDYKMKPTEHRTKPSSPGLPARCLPCKAWYYTYQVTSPGIQWSWYQTSMTLAHTPLLVYLPCTAWLEQRNALLHNLHSSPSVSWT